MSATPTEAPMTTRNSPNNVRCLAFSATRQNFDYSYVPFVTEREREIVTYVLGIA
jgi:hypothetical protein